LDGRRGRHQPTSKTIKTKQGPATQTCGNPDCLGPAQLARRPALSLCHLVTLSPSRRCLSGELALDELSTRIRVMSQAHPLHGSSQGTLDKGNKAADGVLPSALPDFVSLARDKPDPGRSIRPHVRQRVTMRPYPLGWFAACIPFLLPESALSARGSRMTHELEGMVCWPQAAAADPGW